jgi:acetyl-CoA carboxylase carboxyl transferase subunit alpha
MRLTAGEQQALGVVDDVIPEPSGGAHTNHQEAARRLRNALVAQLDLLVARDLDELVLDRYERYRRTGAFSTTEEPRRERRERRRVSDRIRELLSSGRTVLGVGDRGPLRPQAADATDDDAPLGEEI